MSSFSTALSAMTANSAAIDVIGNNLANLNTTGFKRSDVQFQELMEQSLGVGSGIGPVGTVRQFTQGSIQQSGGSMDAAIQGDGFFVVRDSSNQLLYTRAGNFRVDTAGNLTTSAGQKVQGWTAVGGVLNPNTVPGDITLPVGAVLAASASTKMTVDVNLDSRLPDGGSFSAPIEIVDAQGGTHVLTISFTKTDQNQWDYEVTIPAAELTSGGSNSLAQGSLTFDGAGQLTTPAATAAPISVTIAGLANGASDLDIAWSLFDAAGKSRLTQFAQNSGLSAKSQDGYSAGQITEVALEDGGRVVARYSNGRTANVAQIALASIRNPESLIAVGDNNLQAGSETAVAIGTPDSGGRGRILGGSLEGSTVDIAREFTNLITVQRSYQANARVITTSDELLQEVLTLKR